MNLFNDPWLLGGPSFKRITVANEVSASWCVGDIITGEPPMWNQVPINDVFCSVKSGYALMKHKSEEGQSSPSSDRKWWNFLWGANIPRKVKIFL